MGHYYKLEDVPHFMMTCNAINNVRNVELNILKNNLCNAGYEFIWNLFISTGYSYQLNCILGNNMPNIMNLLPPDSYSEIDAIFDKYCKSFLKHAWLFRTNIKSSSANV